MWIPLLYVNTFNDYIWAFISYQDQGSISSLIGWCSNIVMNTTCSVRLCFYKTWFSNMSLSAWMPTYFQKGPPHDFFLLLTCWGLSKPGEDFHHRIICTKLLWVDSYVSSDHTEGREEWGCYIHQTILSGISWQGGVMSVWSRSRRETQAGWQQAAGHLYCSCHNLLKVML